ncbi:PE-PGRS family protein PE_PGRS17-like [Argopecten irradians]|uniref:PE-PGRS family protein PE_PGRS17-like n=1 Tax=Argopecten irradians TaxID=31199 RepID=UPI003716E2AC
MTTSLLLTLLCAVLLLVFVNGQRRARLTGVLDNDVQSILDLGQLVGLGSATLGNGLGGLGGIDDLGGLGGPGNVLGLGGFGGIGGMGSLGGFGGVHIGGLGGIGGLSGLGGLDGLGGTDMRSLRRERRRRRRLRRRICQQNCVFRYRTCVSTASYMCLRTARQCLFLC